MVAKIKFTNKDSRKCSLINAAHMSLKFNHTNDGNAPERVSEETL
jgi:hypothetical protein